MIVEIHFKLRGYFLRDNYREPDIGIEIIEPEHRYKCLRCQITDTTFSDYNVCETCQANLKEIEKK